MWYRNMELAKTLVNVRGGPDALLAASAASGHLSISRLLLEILAVYEIVGALGMGTAPTLVTGNGDAWWYVSCLPSTPSIVSQLCFRDDETYVQASTVETVFGMSRSFVPVFARVRDRPLLQQQRTIIVESRSSHLCRVLFRGLALLLTYHPTHYSSELLTSAKNCTNCWTPGVV
jgi:hypothetical protein